MRIVPSMRLLFWASLVFVPMLGWATSGADTAGLASLILVAFVLLMVVDVAMGANQPVPTASFADKMRLIRDVEDELYVTVQHENPNAHSVRLGLLVDPACQAQPLVQRTTLPAASAARVAWRVRCGERGDFAAKGVVCEHRSPLGLWELRRTLEAEGTIRVYPNLRQDRKQIAATFMRRSGFGQKLQRHVGQGREFEQLREYSPGDSYDEIHWKGTAKRGYPITKIFQVERTQEIYVLMDTSRLLSRPCSDSDEPIFERYVNAALALAMVTERTGDMLGLMTFSDRVHRFLRASGGHGHFLTCRESLYDAKASHVSPDFGEMASFIRLRLRRRALLLVLTCLDDPVLAESYYESIGLLNRQHLVVTCVVSPNFSQALFENEKVTSAAAVYEELSAHLRWQQIQELKVKLRAVGVNLQTLSATDTCTDLVSSYMDIKKRQVL